MVEKDSQGRGWEIKYAFYLSDEDFPEDDDAIEFMNEQIKHWVGRYSSRNEFVKFKELVDL